MVQRTFETSPVPVARAVAEHPRLNWGAVVAGWLVATAVAGLLYVAGLALGFAAFDPFDASGADTAKGFGIGTAAWLVLTWGGGLYIGGLFASWFDGRDDDTMGTMHGVAVWGLSLTATALWMMLGMGQALPSRTSTDQNVAATVAAVSDNDALLILQANVHRLTWGGDHSPGPVDNDAIVGSLLAGHADTARALLQAAGVSSQVIEQNMAPLSAEAEVASTRIKADATRVAEYTSLALWTVFLAGLVALLAAAAGGWAGARNVYRVYHLRHYEGRPIRVE